MPDFIPSIVTAADDQVPFPTDSILAIPKEVLFFQKGKKRIL